MAKLTQEQLQEIAEEKEFQEKFLKNWDPISHKLLEGFQKRDKRISELEKSLERTNIRLSLASCILVYAIVAFLLYETGWYVDIEKWIRSFF